METVEDGGQIVSAQLVSSNTTPAAHRTPI
jgi:hypothetical protein